MVQQVLQRFDFTYSSPQATPLSTRHSLSALPSDESVEPSGPYPELVGCLMYLMTCTRPDLAYPLSILARYVAPGRHRPEHMAASKRVLRYLCSTSGLGLVLGGRRPVVLTGHADASWADDQATQRSSQGYTFSLDSGSVSWWSTRSSSVLGSSCEAEIYAGAMAAQELRWLTYLLTDLGEQPRSPPVLYVDNKAMLALCREHRLEHRTKHIALRYFLARELQQHGQLRLAYMASQANTADIFTKALPPGDHQRFCTMLGTGAGGSRVGGTGVGGAGAAGAGAVDPGAGGAGGTVRPRPYFVPLLQQSQPPFLSASPLPAPSPYTELSGGLTERREPTSHPVSPVHTARHVPRSRPPPFPGMQAMALRPSSVPLCVPLPAPLESSLLEVLDPTSDRARAASPTVSRLLATAVTDPSFESAAASALVVELLDFAAACRLDYATALVAESTSASPLSVGGECALGTDVLEDRQEDFECLAAAVPRFAPMLLALEGDPYAPDIPTPRSYAEAITADPSLFLRTDTSLPPFYILVYVDDLVFAIADTEALTLVKSELQKRHTCTDPGELRSYLGLQITRDRARRTITLTQSHMVHQVFHRFGFQFSSPQRTPLSTSHSLSAPPSDEFVEPSCPYQELVGCVMYLMTCTQPDLACPLSLLARYVAPDRHQKVHSDAAKRVLCYLCSTSGMGLVLGGWGPVFLSGHAGASWVDDSATQRSSLGYTFSLVMPFGLTNAPTTFLMTMTEAFRPLLDKCVIIYLDDILVYIRDKQQHLADLPNGPGYRRRPIKGADASIWSIALMARTRL
ncbi:unnamed protein product [Closterium sp. NIES-54]